MDIKRAPPKKTKKYVAIGVGVVGIAAVSVGLANLKPAAPSVDASTIWFDSVRRGDMVRAVSASGPLVPEHIRIIAAVTAGRVEALPLRAGAQVTPSSVLVELSNPDVDMQLLSSDQALSNAISNSVSLRNSLRQQLMTQERNLSALRTQYRDAVRQAAVFDSLDKKKLASANEVAAARDRVQELKQSIDIETQRLDDMRKAEVEQLRLNDQQVGNTRAILDEQRKRVASMRVLAGEEGVLQVLPLELGQWVNPGMTLARVARPDRLKAQLRVAEGPARDLMIGLPVVIDLHNNTTVKGTVSRIDPAAQGGTVGVDVTIEDKLPPGVRADQLVDGTIEIENMKDVLHVGRPIYGQPDSFVSVFRLTPDKKYAEKVQVRLGRASVSTIEVKSGLNVGDVIITSDMSAHDNADRVRIKW